MLKILLKRGEIAPEEQFFLLSTIFCYLMLELMLNRDPIFSSKQAVIRDNQSPDNESRLYSLRQEQHNLTSAIQIDKMSKPTKGI